MERWNTKNCCNMENKKIDAFLTEVIAVSQKHNLSIGHEDTHGEFIVQKFSQNNADWLMDATDETDDK